LEQSKVLKKYKNKKNKPELLLELELELLLELLEEEPVPSSVPNPIPYPSKPKKHKIQK
jgi:hypothetical protein